MNGAPKLADIGLVAQIDDARSLVGTAGYIPPEGPGTPQADLYSLGEVLYEISLGKDRQDFPQLPPDLQSHPDHAALLELNEVTLKACETDFRKRYQTAQQMHGDLALLERGHSVKRQRAVARRFALAKRFTLAGAAVAFVLAAAGMIFSRFNDSTIQRSTPTAPPETDSIAVLPFFNESNDGPREYLSDAMTDEAMQAFTNISGLRVATRQSVWPFKRATNDLRQLGAQLGVRTVLAGRMRKSSNQLHVAARLLNVADGSALWSASFVRELRDIGAVQSEVVRQVARQLKLPLHEDALRRLETNLARKLEAVHRFDDGWEELAKQTKDGIAQSISRFNRAIELDPNYALAYCGLADAYMIANELVLPPVQALAEMRNKARRAVEIDDNLPDGHKYLGLALFHNFDMAGGELELKRAVELGPKDPWTHNFYALLLRCTGRVKEAGELQLKARQLDPTDSSLLVWGCRQLCAERRFPEALQLAQKHARLNSNSVLTPIALSEVYSSFHRYEEAATELKKARSMDDDPSLIASLGYVCGRLGKTNEARALLQELEHLRSSRYVSGGCRALVHAGLGETNEAIRQLQLAYEERSPGLLILKIDWRWDDVRADRRFVELLKKVGLEK